MRTPHLLRDRAQAYVAPRAAGIALFVIIALGLLAGAQSGPLATAEGNPGGHGQPALAGPAPEPVLGGEGIPAAGPVDPPADPAEDLPIRAPSPPASRPAPIRRPFLPRSPRRRPSLSRTSPETGPWTRPRSLRPSPREVEEPAPPVEPPPPVETPPDETDRQPPVNPRERHR